MPYTLLSAVQQVCRKVNLDPTITAFSNDDDTNLLVEYVNDSLRELSTIPGLSFLDKRGTITLAASTRLYDVASDATAIEVYDWSFTNTTNENKGLELTTLEEIKTRFDDYKTEEGEPAFVYIEGAQIGFYPIPDAADTVEYIYKQYLTRLSTPAATFPFPDDHIDFVIQNTVTMYKKQRGFADYAVEESKARSMYAHLYVKAANERPTYFTKA